MVGENITSLNGGWRCQIASLELQVVRQVVKKHQGEKTAQQEADETAPRIL
jgi:hypothetical protein